MIQIQAIERKNRLAGKYCLVIETLDGDLLLEYEGELLSWRELKSNSSEPARIVDGKDLQLVEKVKKSRRRPGRTHPWKQQSNGSWRLRQEKLKRRCSGGDKLEA